MDVSDRKRDGKQTLTEEHVETKKMPLSVGYWRLTGSRLIRTSAKRTTRSWFLGEMRPQSQVRRLGT
jgi:hypothetical protein